jgi:hypothetical protein
VHIPILSAHTSTPIGAEKIIISAWDCGFFA